MEERNEEEVARERWLEVRRTGIGGSDAGAILGLNPWSSPLKVYTSKLGLAPPTPDNERMAWGRRLEAPVRDWYAEHTGRRVITASDLFAGQVDPGSDEQIAHLLDLITTTCSIVHLDAERCTLRNVAHPWMLVTVDGFVFEPGRGWGVLEIKTAGATQKAKWQDGPPPHYGAQLQHGMACCQLGWGSFGVLFGGQEAGTLDVDRDEAFIADLIDACGAFWQGVQDGTPPDATAGDGHALAAVYPLVEDQEPLLLPPEAAAWDAEYMEHRDAEKYHGGMKKAAETKIRAAMRDRRVAVCPDGTRWTASDVASREVPAHTKAGYRRYSRAAPK